MSELEVLQEISTKLDTVTFTLQKLNSLDFYFGIIVGCIIGFIFWNIIKGVSND